MHNTKLERCWFHFLTGITIDQYGKGFEVAVCDRKTKKFTIICVLSYTHELMGSKADVRFIFSSESQQTDTGMALRQERVAKKIKRPAEVET